jgi:hypothetical protein
VLEKLAMTNSEDQELAFIYQPTLLKSDSQSSFNAVSNAFLQELEPRDFIEKIWTAELIEAEWEISQLRKFKALIVTAARRPALQNLLSVLLPNGDSDKIDNFAERFFTNKEVRRKVGMILLEADLNESSIDAEAFRISIEDLAQINRRLAELASRRDKILERFEDHRAGLAMPTRIDQKNGTD